MFLMMSKSTVVNLPSVREKLAGGESTRLVVRSSSLRYRCLVLRETLCTGLPFGTLILPTTTHGMLAGAQEKSSPCCYCQQSHAVSECQVVKESEARKLSGKGSCREEVSLSSSMPDLQV